jgi:hypothetical protein
MPHQVFRPSTVIASNAGAETHLKITLELNINLNSNGIEATIAATQAKVLETDTDIQDKKTDIVPHIIPDFNPSPTIEFGKKVESPAKWFCVQCKTEFPGNVTRPEDDICFRCC